LAKCEYFSLLKQHRLDKSFSNFSPRELCRKNKKFLVRIKYAGSGNNAVLAKRAAIIRGDGTGPELVDAMMHVLKSCNSQSELIMCDAGSEQWEKHGGATYIPDATMKLLEESDACYKGPTTTIPRPNAPRSVAVTIRQKFELYSNIRPIKKDIRQALA
jgi:isocitrate dehydrogenase